LNSSVKTIISIALRFFYKKQIGCDAIVGSALDTLRQPLVFSFVLDRPPGYRIIFEPKAIHYTKINKSVLNTMFFFY